MPEVWTVFTARFALPTALVASASTVLALLFTVRCALPSVLDASVLAAFALRFDVLAGPYSITTTNQWGYLIGASDNSALPPSAAAGRSPPRVPGGTAG